MTGVQTCALPILALSFKGQLTGKASIGTLSDPNLTRIGEFINVALARHP